MPSLSFRDAELHLVAAFYCWKRHRKRNVRYLQESDSLAKGDEYQCNCEPSDVCIHVDYKEVLG